MVRKRSGNIDIAIPSAAPVKCNNGKGNSARARNSQMRKSGMGFKAVLLEERHSGSARLVQSRPLAILSVDTHSVIQGATFAMDRQQDVAIQAMMNRVPLIHRQMSVVLSLPNTQSSPACCNPCWGFLGS